MIKRLGVALAAACAIGEPMHVRMLERAQQQERVVRALRRTRPGR